jgi:hypothetical protein
MMVPMNSMEPEDILMRNQELTLAVARLTAERDEARRKFCEMMSNNSRLEFTTPQWFAEEEDWDCYKEDGK